MYSAHLKVFMAAAEYGSFTAAAERLFMTPAGVMRQVNAFENEMEATLFERSNRGVQLTDAGRVIDAAGQRIISEADSAILTARHMQREGAKIIRVGSSFLNPGSSLIEFWNTQLAAVHPEYHLQLVPYSDDHNSILSVVASLGIDFDFMVGALQSAQMLARSQFLPLGKAELCVAVPLRDPLASRDLIQPEDLYGRGLFVVSAGDSLPIDKFRAWALRKHPEIRLQDAGYYYDVDTFNMCETSGVPLLTLDIWSKVHCGLVTLPVTWDFSVKFGLLYSPSVAGVPAEFLSHIRRHLKDLAQ